MDIEGFSRDLIGWFNDEKRDLPWRKDQDPYKIWVSEIMLQQTRVDTVIPYFNRFIDQFPTIEALSM
ncbi:MAG TPA: A/G-specific adenine glycosylase, partial [Bacillus sp. (in: firmicutes)]